MFYKLLLLILPLAAPAFTVMTEGLTGWQDGSVTFYFNPADCARDPGEVERAIGDAVKAWNQVPTANIHLVYGGRTEQTGDQSNPVVECVTSGLTGIVGSGFVTTTEGRITSGHVELNSDSSDAASIAAIPEAELPVVLGHEMGHVLGLGHTQSQASLMYYSVEGKNQLALSADDADGLSFLYPRHEPGNGVLGCGSLGPASGEGGSNTGGGLLPWLGVVLAVALVLRRPKKALSLR